MFNKIENRELTSLRLARLVILRLKKKLKEP